MIMKIDGGHHGEQAEQKRFEFKRISQEAKT